MNHNGKEKIGSTFHKTQDDMKESINVFSEFDKVRWLSFKRSKEA